jgi:hemerythrin-like domain-containing protein
MVENILGLMVIQHGMLESLFSVFQLELKKDQEKAKKSLSEFSWELKKHFFIEENVIFNFMSWKDSAITIVIDQLKKEHSIMLEMTEKMLNDFSVTAEQNSEQLAELLKSHRGVEEKNLYPRLDADLSEAQKDQIIKRANQIRP